MKEMRVKGEYLQHDIIKASMGFKIAAHGLEECVAGSQLYVTSGKEDLESKIDCVKNEFLEIEQKFKLS